MEGWERIRGQRMTINDSLHAAHPTGNNAIALPLGMGSRTVAVLGIGAVSEPVMDTGWFSRGQT